ncbi:hypothetical protein B0T22DRAFT_296204 [Podospora appendiculata]|uniref:Uncharacterized protein n=1 Tax=Podospora appendiculata TaxID=314037 RepID=A0AAE1C8I2_9PEZI|nr:hypothetical protein B0T22DRAFT_296204 [Podospora appendiculata]
MFAGSTPPCRTMKLWTPRRDGWISFAAACGDLICTTGLCLVDSVVSWTRFHLLRPKSEVARWLEVEASSSPVKKIPLVVCCLGLFLSSYCFPPIFTLSGFLLEPQGKSPGVHAGYTGPGWLRAARFSCDSGPLHLRCYVPAVHLRRSSCLKHCRLNVETSPSDKCPWLDPLRRHHMLLSIAD